MSHEVVVLPSANDSPTNDAGASPWIRGFHGAIFNVNDLSPTILRQVALTRRSTGLGRLDGLVALPRVGPDRFVPTAVRGDRPVGRDGSHPSSPPLPMLDEEDLTEFLDRRLREARYLLLPNRGRGYAGVKRVLDVVVALLMLVVCGPLMLALAAVIRLDSPGPALFRQVRVTRGGRTFRFYKFRTMYVDARDRFPELYDYSRPQSEIGDTYYKLADDPRNTRVGRWLRRTTLDELPNLLNVMTGDISLVGPRPDLPELIRLYQPEELACLFTKAGLTGVAQVAGRSLLTVRERLTLDLRYVSQQTLLLDLRILWRTVVVVLSGKGAF